jgi:hypothetical protein
VETLTTPKLKSLIASMLLELAMYSKPVIFVVISILVVVLIYSSSTYDVFAEWVFSEESCTSTRTDASYTCCYQIYDIEGPSIEVVATYCKECTFYPDREDVCTEPKKEALEEPPTPAPSGPSVVPGEGPLSQDGGVLQQPPADQGATALRTGEPPTPICAPGSVFDPDINECVLEKPPELCPDGSIRQPTVPAGPQPKCPPSEAEQPSAAEEPEEPQAEEPSADDEQLSGENGSEDNSNN